MSGLFRRSKLCAAVLFVCLLQPSIEAQSNLQYIKVARAVIEARLMKYSGDDKQRENTLRQMFSEAGCDRLHLTEQPVKGSKLPNIVCVLPGSADKVIIVGAHYDHVVPGDGVVDNWSSAALLPSLYTSISFAPRAHTYIFIGFTDEEKGAVGSHYYADHMTKEQAKNTDAMVNMDTLGLGPTEVWDSHSDNRLIGNLLYISHLLNLPVIGENVQQASFTDAESFAFREIPRITIHSLTQETWDAHIIHSAKDNLSAMQLDDYYSTYSLLAAYVAFLDQSAQISAITPKEDLPPQGIKLDPTVSSTRRGR